MEKIDGDIAPAPRRAARPSPGRQQMDRHWRHLTVRGAWLQSRRRAHRPEIGGQPQRRQDLGQARIPQSRRHGRAGHTQHQVGLAPSAPIRSRRRRARARFARHDPLDRAQRRLARFKDGARAAQCGEAAAVPRCRRLDGRPCARLRRIVFGGARRVQAPRILLFPQLPLRHRVEGLTATACRTDRRDGNPAHLRCRPQGRAGRRRQHEPLRDREGGRQRRALERRAGRNLAAPSA